MEQRISIITLGVNDMQRSIRFYRDGLGFETNAKDTDGWAIFRTSGTRLSLFPKDKLADDAGISASGHGFGGITLAHNVRERDDVNVLIQKAIEAGGQLLKEPTEAFWGGYSGYFGDPDGYPWEVAWSKGWVFDESGTLWGGSLGPMPEAQPSNSGGRLRRR